MTNTRISRIHAVDRPYLVTFPTGPYLPLGAREVQRLLDHYEPHTANSRRVVLNGQDRNDPTQRITLEPATIGGGPAFTFD